MTPKNDDELAIAFMLTEQFLSKEKLSEASRLIKSGQKIVLPPHVKTAVLAALQSARSQETTRSKSARNGLIHWAIFSFVIFLIYLIFTPWPHYQLALFLNKIPTYEGFINRFPESYLVDDAKKQILILKEDDVWAETDSSKNIKSLRKYKILYPDGKYLIYANDQLRECADSVWYSISKTDSKKDILDFSRKYRETTKTAEAQARIIEIADAKWDSISNTDSKEDIIKFLEDNPETTKSSEAKSRMVTIADAQWLKIASGRSVGAINGFLNDFPETSMRHAAEQRIQELYDDFEWVREQDLLKFYKKFLNRHPNHPHKTWIEKRIIDLEVKEIAAGDYGVLPPAQPIQLGGRNAIVQVNNKTDYELSVRYSGPESKKLVIPTGAIKSISLPPGEYQVAATVTARNIRNYFGRDKIHGGSYSSEFYIKSEYSNGNSAPSINSPLSIPFK
jgi:outer membrane protein assembly factor BamD (BamD/ComL family)